MSESIGAVAITVQVLEVDLEVKLLSYNNKTDSNYLGQKQSLLEAY